MGDTGSGQNETSGADREEEGIQDTDEPVDSVGGEGDRDDHSDGFGFGYEIAGGVVAWLGFIFTPLVTAVPAGYCAFQVRERSPGTYYGIFAVVAATCLFWILVLFAPEILDVILGLLPNG